MGKVTYVINHYTAVFLKCEDLLYSIVSKRKILLSLCYSNGSTNLIDPNPKSNYVKSHEWCSIYLTPLGSYLLSHYN